MSDGELYNGLPGRCKRFEKNDRLISGYVVETAKDGRFTYAFETMGEIRAMLRYRRNLPPDNATLFVTYRLEGGSPLACD